MSNKVLSKREEYLKKKRTKRLIKYGFAIFLVISLFIITVLFFHIQKFRISVVTLSGGVLVQESDISSSTKDFLSGNYFWLFPKNNAFLYPQSALEKMLKEKFKRIDKISVHRNGFKTLNIVITERNLNALWCGFVPTPEVQEHCYFMDNNGTIFAEAPNFSGDAYFKYYGLVGANMSPIGIDYIASTTEFHGLSVFIRRVQDMALHPVYMLASDNSGQFTIGLAGGGLIYFDTQESLEKTGTNLQALLQTVSASTTYSAFNFDYIDLRFGNKLFYKLK